jgi:hypothetical protein
VSPVFLINDMFELDKRKQEEKEKKSRKVSDQMLLETVCIQINSPNICLRHSDLKLDLTKKKLFSCLGK